MSGFGWYGGTPVIAAGLLLWRTTDVDVEASLCRSLPTHEADQSRCGLDVECSHHETWGDVIGQSDETCTGALLHYPVHLLIQYTVQTTHDTTVTTQTNLDTPTDGPSH